MSFLILSAIGLAGLLLMALPGLQRHSHSARLRRASPLRTVDCDLGMRRTDTPAVPSMRGWGRGAAGRAGRGSSPAVSARSNVAGAKAGTRATRGADGRRALRHIPSPRAIFSVMTMFGAFGYALVAGMQYSPWTAGLVALVPACGIEYFAVRPLWNFMFRFQGQPCSSLATLLFCEAKAVTPFRNGRGLVSVEHDGRIVQLSARLKEPEANARVAVGDRLLIEEVNVAAQRVVVSVC